MSDEGVNRLDVVDAYQGRVLRSVAMTQDADDPTKWHLADLVTLTHRERGVAHANGGIYDLLEGPTAAPTNTIFITPPPP